MITDDSNCESDDSSRELLQGLEQLALALDAQQYPGPAWPFAPLPRPRPPGRRVVAAWKIVTGIATAAGIGLAAVMLRPIPGPHAVQPPAPLAAKIQPAALAAADKLPQGKQVPAKALRAATDNAPLHAEQSMPGKEVAENNSPQVVVVEDLDSYSLIDLSGSSPVVSYMSKDASSIDCPVPVPLGVQLSQDSSDRML